MSGLDDLFRGVTPDGLDVESLLSNLQQFTGAAAESAQRMAVQTADAWSKDKLVHVWVNAQGVVVQVEFDDQMLTAATGAEAGAAVVQATQAAAAEMRAKTDEYQAALWQQVAQFGVRPINEIDEFKAMQPQVPLSAPGSRERRGAVAESEHAAGEQETAAPEWWPAIRDKD